MRLRPVPAAAARLIFHPPLIPACAALADVLWIKVGLLHGPTVWGGLAVGLLFELVFRWLRRP